MLLALLRYIGDMIMMSLSIIQGSKGKPTFAKLSRQNTGEHPMDSGGLTGRHWQSKLPPNSPYFNISKWTGSDGTKHMDIMAYIPLHTFLDKHLVIDTVLTKALRKAEKKARYGFNYREAAEWVAEQVGETIQVSDYSYNWETDLTQDFQFSVISSSSDWYYDEHAIVTIQTHNGADARGGFSDVVVCRPTDDLSRLLEPQAGVRIISAKDANGRELTHNECQEIDEHWQVGYSNYPMSHFTKDVVSVKQKDKFKGEEIEVVLKSGVRARVYISSNIDY